METKNLENYELLLLSAFAQGQRSCRPLMMTLGHRHTQNIMKAVASLLMKGYVGYVSYDDLSGNGGYFITHSGTDRLRQCMNVNLKQAK